MARSSRLYSIAKRNSGNELSLDASCLTQSLAELASVVASELPGKVDDCRPRYLLALLTQSMENHFHQLYSVLDNFSYSLLRENLELPCEVEGSS